MSKCKNCKSERIISVSGKPSDCFGATYKDKEYNGYVLKNIGIGGGDYIEFDYCLDCGQIQSDNFPIEEDIVREQFSQELK